MVKRLSTSQLLHEELRQIIAQAAPGERLPSEPKLARELGVSRATLREAMRAFEIQGLIRRRQGSGTYVIHPTYILESGLEVLESIESMAARLNIEVSVDDVQIDHRFPEEIEAEKLSIPEGQKVLSAKRVIVADDRPVAYLIDVVPDDVVHPDEINYKFTGSMLDFFLKRGTPTIVSSLCEINAEPANQDVARALEIQRRDGLLLFSALLYTENGRIIDYSLSYFLPGYFRFHVIRRVG
jgi:GntR family transcriptional regulator